MRVIARQNLWRGGRAFKVGEAVDMSDELAAQLCADGLVEIVQAAKIVESEISEAQTVEKPKVRRRKKS
ncbi:MAG: hypothetical protein IKO51_08095 [Clostridia bacterium]|nr:hypothetical protein [Fibrobacter sp.]MBR4636307.1 hypothetical protein [Clostridia bacterium]